MSTQTETTQSPLEPKLAFELTTCKRAVFDGVAARYKVEEAAEVFIVSPSIEALRLFCSAHGMGLDEERAGKVEIAVIRK